MKPVGAQIRKFREWMGWDQEELAYRAGLSGSGVGKLEREQYSPTMKTLERIAAALGISVIWLLTGEPGDDAKVARRQPAAA